MSHEISTCTTIGLRGDQAHARSRRAKVPTRKEQADQGVEAERVYSAAALHMWTKLEGVPLHTYLLFGLLAVVTLVGLGQPFGNGDEVIYAQNIREMQASGDWGVLSYGGSDTLLRPTLPFVISSFSGSVIGGEFGLRLPMALASLATLALVYVISLRAWRRHDAAAIATIACASVPSFYLFSRSLLSDPIYVAMTLVAFGGTLWAETDKRGILLAAAGMGAAVACKSLAAGLPALALVPWLVHAAIRHNAWRTVAQGAGIFLALAAPFFVYSYLRFGDDFVEEHLGLSLGKRLSGKDVKVGMSDGRWAYIFHLWHSDGPLVVLWSAVASAGGLWLWHKGDRKLGCAVASALALLVMLSLMATRLPHYILGVYPLLAISLAGVYAQAASKLPHMRRALGSLFAGTVAVAAIFAGIARAPNEALLPSPMSVLLGKAARAEVKAGASLYTLDLYAPVLAYYANTPWQALYSSEEMSERIGGIYIFKKAGNVRTVPPWPEARYLLAAPASSLARLELPIRRLIGEFGDMLLVEIGSSP